MQTYIISQTHFKHEKQSTSGINEMNTDISFLIVNRSLLLYAFTNPIFQKTKTEQIDADSGRISLLGHDEPRFAVHVCALVMVIAHILGNTRRIVSRMASIGHVFGHFGSNRRRIQVLEAGVRRNNLQIIHDKLFFKTVLPGK